MAKKNALPEGYKTTRTDEKFPIAVFENEGDYVEGIFQGIKMLPSNYGNGKSVLWMVGVKNPVKVININKEVYECEAGEIILVNEKTTMKDIRISVLSEGDPIMLVYNGKVEGKKNSYKDFEVFIKEN